jgi:FkbM family methyltransferase
MKFVLVAKQEKNVDPYLESLQCLVERGHDVAVAIQEPDEARDRRLAQTVASPRFRVVACPPARIDEWAAVAPLVRRLRDCIHFLQPRFSSAPAVRMRVFSKLDQELALGADVDALLSALHALSPTQLARLEAVLRLAEQSVPTAALFDEFLRSESPDFVLISPLVHFGSAQADVAASARRLGIPVWMLLFSWDNLSTKGCMHVEPDLMFVWNEQQRKEAGELHRFPPSRVVVVGAPRFDRFFALRAALTREQFHEPLGLDPERPTLLYLCSSLLIAPRELEFVREWLAALRSHPSDALRSANVVVRPHPDVDLLPAGASFERLRWPQSARLDAHSARPFGDPRAVVLRTSFKDPNGLFESLVHSTAVVGLNTTAELEAGIVGRPVFTIAANGHGIGPRPTVHFHYLTRESGGFVSVASTLDEHRRQVAAALRAGVDSAPIRAFIQSFLRPHGIDRPVAPVLADALEQRAGGERTVAAPVAPEAAFDPRTLAADDGEVVPLAYDAARILVRATPEARRDMVDGRVRVDHATVKWLERWVNIGDVVYDVNAGFGAYVLLAARQRGAVAVAFEPGYEVYAALCRNVMLNGCQGSVVPVPLALAGVDGLADIKYERLYPGGARYGVRSRAWRARSPDSVQSNVHTACTTRLDTAVECYGLPPPTHLRVSPSVRADDVLKGAARTLQCAMLRTLWLHVAIHEEEALVTVLGAAGFQVATRRIRRSSVQLAFSR